MLRTAGVAAALAAGLVVAGCSDEPDATSTDRTTPSASASEGPTVAADDLSNLVGRTWTVVATIADGATQRLAVRTARPWITVGNDGLSGLFTGCNSGRTVVRVEDGTVTFGPTSVTRKACQGPARLTEEAVLDVLDGAVDKVDFNGKVLILEQGDSGVVFQVR